MEDFFERLKVTVSAKENEPMSLHTTFRIGGPAKYFAEIGSIEELKAVRRLSDEYKIKTFVVGRGSNLLVSDEGIDGLVLCVGNAFADIYSEGNEIIAGAGASLSKIAQYALKNSLTGFEFAAGIPGSLGGAIYMNAGAYGGEMKDVVKESYAIGASNEALIVTEHFFGYRTSVYKDSGSVITGARLRLEKGDKEQISKTMEELSKKRRDKQPVDMPSAGSVFKRPEGYFAGALIEEAGLKGMKVGGAEVSEKHAGFIVNTGSATADDVKKLIEIIKETVYDKFKVMLETEIRFI